MEALIIRQAEREGDAAGQKTRIADISGQGERDVVGQMVHRALL